MHSNKMSRLTVGALFSLLHCIVWRNVIRKEIFHAVVEQNVGTKLIVTLFIVVYDGSLLLQFHRKEERKTHPEVSVLHYNLLCSRNT